MEKLGQVAKDLVHELAYTPTTDLTIVLETDKRAEVIVKAPSEKYDLDKLNVAT
jgi:hypothetical protein